MLIKYFIKSVYGNTMIYVKDKKLAGVISNLTGRKTLTESDIINLERLGHTFEKVLS